MIRRLANSVNGSGYGLPRLLWRREMINLPLGQDWN
jgi:hypothetical protein